jgi:hypothetical protein
MTLPLSVPLPFNCGVRTITQDHAEHMSSALLNFRWHPCGRPVIESKHNGDLVRNPLVASINPGNSVDEQLVYDLPVGTQPAAIELRDSTLLGGATVKLAPASP